MTTSPPHLARLAEVHATPAADGARTVYAAIRSVRHSLDRNGARYYDLVLADVSATFPAKIWGDARAYAETEKANLREGMVVKVLFTIGSFRDAVQLTIQRLRVLGEEDAASWDPDLVWGPGWERVEGLRRKTLVFDIETVPGIDLAEVPEVVSRAVSRAAERSRRYDDGEAELDLDKAMGLSPYFGKIVSLAFGEGNVAGSDEHGDGEPPVVALVVPPAGREHDRYPDWIRPMTEPELLRSFWHLADSAELVVSFNGRGFDVPYLVIRSLIHGIPARVDLLSSPYSLRPHLDLFRLIGQGRGGLGTTSLEVVCWALGIESPKGEMDGSLVAPTYARGDIERIAEYNAADVRATTAVFRHLREQLLPFRNDW